MIINKIEFPDHQYFKLEMPKKIIVLHHTVSGNGIEGDVSWWKKTPERVGTPFIIDREGEVSQLFDEKYWIHHLGIRQHQLNQFQSQVTNQRLNELSIGIELDSWGGLVKKNGDWYSYTGSKIECKNVQEYPRGYRGWYAFEKYTEKQIEALEELLQLLTEKHGIKKDYYPEMFDFNEKALKGYHGIWSHTSYRPDKSDCHPQPELIEMLQKLKSNVAKKCC